MPFTFSILSSSVSEDSDTSAMREYREGPTFEALQDDESGSVHTDHSGYNTGETAYAPLPAEGVQPMRMPMHSSGELCMYVCTPYNCTQLKNCDVLMYARSWVAMCSTTIRVKMVPWKQ